MQDKRMKEKEKLCKLYYNEIVKYLNKLESDYKNGRISYEEHFKKESRFLKGRSEKWWYDYLRQCVVKLRNGEDCRVESPRRESKLPVNLIVIFVAIFGIILASQYTGFVTFGSEFVAKDVDLAFVNSTIHDISLDHNPVSLKVSGSYSGKGSFRLYLEDNGNRLLIADNSATGNNLITGNIVANITENATTTTQETTIGETTTSILENVTTTVLEETSTTVIQNTTTSIFQNTTTSIIENTTTTSDTTSTILQNATTSTTTSILQAITFSDACIETCILTNVSSTIKLIAIIEDGSLTINKISYSYLTDIQQAIVSGNVTVNESIKQLPAEIGKPVTWSKEVYIKNEENTVITKSITVDIPDIADNIKIDGQNITTISSGNITYTINTNLQPAEELIKNITYDTPAPTVSEEVINDGKKIVVSSDIHYENIKASTTVNEMQDKTWNVYWVRNNSKISLSTTRLDTNNNGLTDKVEWIIPGLSSQTFEVLAESSTKAFYSNLDSMKPSLMFLPANASDQLGESVALGNINGDAFSDIIIGAITAEKALSGSGAVYIFYGKKYNTSKTFNLDTQSANVTIYGAGANDFLGGFISTGDVNGDGKDDIAMGASGETTIYILYGANYTNGAIIDLSSLSANLSIINGGDSFGTRYIDMGDENGDGKDDILMGCNLCDPGGRSNAGQVFLIYGKAYTHGKIINIGTQGANVTISGQSLSDQLGSSVALGDMDGDGKKEIMVGAHQAEQATTGNVGIVYIFYGRDYTSPKAFDFSVIPFANISIFGNNTVSGNLGNALASKDINGDNKDEVIMTAPGVSTTGTNSGSAYILYGKDYGNGAKINLSVAGVNMNITISGLASTFLGDSVAVGDYNNDGKNDTIIGAQNFNPGSLTNAGAAFLLYGKNYTTPRLFNLASVSANFTVYGANASDKLASDGALAIGDINNDGAKDILVGALDASPMGGQDGIAYVIWGGERAPNLATTPIVNDTTPVVNKVLNCTTGLYTDPDSDPLYKNFFKWYRSNVEIQFNTTSKLDLNSQAEEVGDNIICSQKASDGYFNTSWKNSTTIKVATSPSVSFINVPSGGNTVSFPKRTAEIITPDPLTLDLKDSVTIPIRIKNNIDIPLRGISLYAKSDTPDLSFTFTQDKIQVLNSGQEITVNMIVESHSTPGSYSIDIGINVTQPKYSDITKLYVTLVDRGIFNKTIIVTRVAFAKDLFKENPECLELDELLVRAQNELDLNNFEKARELTEEAVRGCKDLVTSEFPATTQRPANRTNMIFIISLMAIIIAVITVYYFLKLKKS